MSVPRLELDYLASPRRTAWPGIVLLAASLALAAHLLVRYHNAGKEVLRLEVERGLILPERHAIEDVPRERQISETRAAEAVMRQLTIPWAALVGALENASSRDVALLQLQPDASQRRLHLTAEARDRQAMFSYLARLEAAPALAEVHLISHELQQQDPQRPIQFSLQAMLK